MSEHDGRHDGRHDELRETLHALHEEALGELHDELREELAPLFPEGELVLLAEHFELIAQAWPTVTASGRRLRNEHQARAQVCRDAIVAHRHLAEQLVDGPSATARAD